MNLSFQPVLSNIGIMDHPWSANLQAQPDQVCKQLGLCVLNGDQYVR